jgi:hypothetical protein
MTPSGASSPPWTPEQFRDCFAAWVAAVAQRLDLKQVAIDG